MLAAAAGLCDALAVAHPSHRKLAELHGGDCGALLRGCKARAALLVPCGNDDARSKAGGEDEACLSEATAGCAGRVAVREFEGMAHGFILRGDVKGDPAVAAEVGVAMNLIAAFFVTHLAMA